MTTRSALPAGIAARELSELLEIIAGTTHQLENIWDGDHGSEKYLAMLRTSVERAARITAQLIGHSAGETPAADDGSKPLDLPQGATKTARILIVDDEPAALALFQQLLAAPGYEIVTAQTGFECLDKVSRQAFDLVVLDYTMPFMDGEETFRRIHGMKPELPVLLSTGFIAPRRLERMLASGLAAFLRKPLDPTELVERVAELLGEQSALGEASEPRGIAAAL